MGFRVVGARGFLPACIHDGALWVRWGKEVRSVPVPVGDMVFPEQCNFIMDRTLRCYLVNRDYRFILWESGAAIVMHGKSRTLRGNMMVRRCDSIFNPVDVGKVGSFLPGSYKQLVTIRYAKVKGAGGQAMLYSDDQPFCFCLDMGNEQMSDFEKSCYEWSLQQLFPRFQYWREVGRVWYVNIVDGSKLELQGELLRQDRYKSVGGWSL